MSFLRKSERHIKFFFRPKSGHSISRTPGSSSEFKLEVGMSVFCNNELGMVTYFYIRH